MSGEVDKRFDLDVYLTMDERGMVEHSEVLTYWIL